MSRAGSGRRVGGRTSTERIGGSAAARARCDPTGDLHARARCDTARTTTMKLGQTPIMRLIAVGTAGLWLVNMRDKLWKNTKYSYLN